MYHVSAQDVDERMINVHDYYCSSHAFSAWKQLAIASYQERYLLRPNNLSVDLTDDCVNNFISYFE